MGLIDDLRNAVLDGDASGALAIANEALAAGSSAEQLLNDALITGMQAVGQLYEEGEIFVPEMLVAARAMRSALSVIRPHLALAGVESHGRVAIGTVHGDLHDIGKNLVAMFLEGAGFEVIDLGVDVDPERFVAEASEGADVIAMSALLTTTMVNMSDVVDALVDAGVRSRVRVLVGGAPLSADFAREIGADGYAPDAAQAPGVLAELLRA